MSEVKRTIVWFDVGKYSAPKEMVAASDFDALLTLARNAQAALAQATWGLPEKSEAQNAVRDACHALHEYLTEDKQSPATGAQHGD